MPHTVEDFAYVTEHSIDQVTEKYYDKDMLVGWQSNLQTWTQTEVR